MKITIFVLALAVVMMEARIYDPPNHDIRKDTILINRPTLPPRFPRSAQRDNGGRNTVNVQVQKPMSGQDRRPNINVDYQRRIWENQRGHISAGAGISKFPGQKPQTHVGVQGTIRFKREAIPLELMDPRERYHDTDDKEELITKSEQVFSAEKSAKIKRDASPQGSVVITGQKPMSGPDRRPTVNLDYQHRIWQGRNGEITANGGISKTPGSRPDKHVGIQGTWRF